MRDDTVGVRSLGLWALVAAAAVGCGGGQSAAPTVAPTSEVSGVQAPGQLDAELVRLSANAPGVMKIKLRVGADGAVRKLAVYHRDASVIPEAVRALAAERYPGAEPRYYESEVYADLGRVYEVEVADAEGTECEVAASADGTLLYSECKLPVDAIDPRVKATVERVVPGGTVVELESKQAPDRVEMSIEVKVGDVEHYVRTTAEGELLEHLLRVPAIIEVPAP